MDAIGCELFVTSMKMASSLSELKMPKQVQSFDHRNIRKYGNAP
jgi:hypothetical protein